MTKKITSIGFVNGADGLRITYAYNKIDDMGNILSSNNRGSFLDEKEDTLEILEKLKEKVFNHIENS